MTIIRTGLFPVNDMQTPASRKEPSIFIIKFLRNVRKRMKNQCSDFYFWNYGQYSSQFSNVFNRPKMLKMSDQKIRNIAFPI